MHNDQEWTTETAGGSLTAQQHDIDDNDHKVLECGQTDSWYTSEDKIASEVFSCNQDQELLPDRCT